jgi:hypothetical protein
MRQVYVDDELLIPDDDPALDCEIRQWQSAVIADHTLSRGAALLAVMMLRKTDHRVFHRFGTLTFYGHPHGSDLLRELKAAGVVAHRRKFSAWVFQLAYLDRVQASQGGFHIKRVNGRLIKRPLRRR